MISRSLRGLAPLAALVAFALSAAGAQQVKDLPKAEPPVPPADQGWPRVFATSKGDTLTVFQPQVDSWVGDRIEAHMAVGSLLANASVTIYGVALFTARTDVDKVNRVVYLEEMEVTKVTFPSAHEREAQFQSEITQVIPARSRAIALDRLEAALSAAGAAEKANRQPLATKPPAIRFSPVPAVLIAIDGQPAWRPMKGTELDRVINMSALLVRDTKSKTLYLHLFDGWMSAATIDGPWAVTKSAPRTTINDLNTVLRALVDSGEADPLEGAPLDPSVTGRAPSLLDTPVPQVIIATTPTELIVTEGAPKWEAVEGTGLSYISNTTGRVFKNADDHKYYVLLAGRWFDADSLAGPWAYVPGKALPADFAKIPDSSAVETVKAAVPGTAQAAEAVIANTIPQTTSFARGLQAPTIAIDGAPKLLPIEGTDLQYVQNASRPMIRITDISWLACVNGAWFQASSPNGPWTLAADVPASIYSIPPQSPMHYTTYVHVYKATADSIYAGYTNGYTGAIVGDDGTVVYGTGYDYPAWVGTDWYAPIWAYGYGANLGWTPWYGWRYGAGYGYAYGWGGYGLGPYRGVGRWGAGNWGVSTGNVYDSWGFRSGVYNATAGYDAITGNRWYDRASVSYNSRTGIATAGQRYTVGNAFTGTYATGTRGVAYDARTGRAVDYGGVRTAEGGVGHVGNTVFASRDGSVYRWNPGTGWQEGNVRGGWGAVGDAGRAGYLDNQRYARDMGEARYGGYRMAGGPRAAGWSGGFRGRR
ncbi:MAG TPA: hypothetical protein VMT93_01600 [Gemmatimonadaceae bacterium]|nr:hypothetical protein [Gemmatimonadaceae bacterium]